jgi:hypothetical protein
MSDYHILSQDRDEKTVSVVFHIPVPSTGTNRAGLSWRDAVVREQGGSASITSVLPDISATEDTQLKAGELYEKRETVRFSSKNLTPAQRQAEVEARFTEASTELISEKQVVLEWIGFQGDIS